MNVTVTTEGGTYYRTYVTKHYCKTGKEISETYYISLRLTIRMEQEQVVRF